MARITTRRPDEEEEDMIEDVEGDEEEEVSSAPAVSDSRRRRKLKRGEEPGEVEQPARKDRPTPSQRAETEKSKNFLVRFYDNIVEYLKDTRSELQKVSWLSREDTIRLAEIVLIVTAISAAFLGFVGFMFALLTQAIAGGSAASGALTIGIIVVTAGLWLFRDRLFGGHLE